MANLARPDREHLQLHSPRRGTQPPQSGTSITVLRRKERSADGESDISSFEEQKNWISSLLTAASAAGEERIRFTFQEDKRSAEGCSACGPDFGEGDFLLDSKRDANTRSDLQQQLWRSNRSCLSLQSCCWKFYNSKLFKWCFRGGEYSDGDLGGQYPNVEPAQKFRCGWKMLQERGFVLLLLFLSILTIIVAAFPVFIRLVTSIYIANIDFSRIRTFTISCNGCKVQISNNVEWAGYFAPCNTNLYFPADG
jgi:hypothetical protein